MATVQISDGESGASVRGKLNSNLGILGGIEKISASKIYDAFERTATTAGAAVGSADSGQSYVQLEGTNTYDGSAATRSLEGTGVVGILNSGILNAGVRAGFNILANYAASGSSLTSVAAVYLWIDVDNWVKFELTQGSIIVRERVIGTTSLIETASFPNVGQFRRCLNDIQINYSSQQNVISAVSKGAGISITPFTSSIISQASDIAYFALGIDGDACISNWVLTRAPFV